MNKFLSNNSTLYKVLRTIVQGIIGVLLANVDVLIDGLTIPTEYKAFITALVVAILTPIMSELGKKNEVVEDEIEYMDYLEEGDLGEN